ncbi:MAG: preprotein translocase subunit SecG [Akkermansiaceae bacterium]|nr:preprotein translocase subunit SecG [Akkermansiaceae bacterium]
MILAGILDISINLLLVIHVTVSLLLILVVLMQRPKQEGLGAAFGGGMTDSMWGAQTTNVLQKGTVYLGTLFVALSLVLAILIGNKNYDPALQAKRDAEAAAAAEPAPAEAPAPTPATPGPSSIREEVEKAEAAGGTNEEPADKDAPAAPEGTTPAAPEGTTPAAPEGTTPAAP